MSKIKHQPDCKKCQFNGADSTRFLPVGRHSHTAVDASDYSRLIAMGPYHMHNSGYAQTSRNQLLHRIAIPVLPGQQVDHLNGDRLDNRKANLRIATHAQNCYNKRKMAGRRFKGVYQDGSPTRFYSKISFENKQIHLGHFSTEEEAANAYDNAAGQLYGEFAELNFKLAKVPRPLRARIDNAALPPDTKA